MLAHRTSPTNIGLYLLSVAAAQDFGWLGLLDTTERLEATLQTMARLERFRGHFYNWYDTSDLSPLEPQYISSVDSGNLAGHLITLNNVVGEMGRRPIIHSRWRVGIGDAVDLLRETLSGVTDDAGVTRKPLDEAIGDLATSLRMAPSTPVGIAGQLKELASKARTVADRALSLAKQRGDGGVETLAGFLLVRLGHIPVPGETITYDGRRMTVMEMDNRRIARIRVEPVAKAEPAKD